ncbi:MAG TPA: DUF2948 family protein [Alphaproteobacteria bacterium]|jgi:hypothetical protein|nr:DUF2948 family protein [Alphaproteobacteria bacterium]MDP6269190.1 DUF2948 family protein [Alphaproteobacteria bacterium]MDP7426596.1 DUF2948 family protein [Alphaproteobacteria bacterium]HJM52316.1 DUF2948 family protein [Alphaproteobacteria bacterium]
MSTPPLKLSAQDGQDLAVISACLQDALTRMGDMIYLPREHRFAAIFSRFMWEAAPARKRGHGLFRRVSCGVHFNGVLGARIQGLKQDSLDEVLELLALEWQEGEDAEAAITLVFAGGGLIRLEAECIECQLTDMGAPWTTRRRPAHAVTEEEAGTGADVDPGQGV